MRLTARACLGALLLAAGCAPGSGPLELASVSEALGAGSEELDFASPAARARLFGLVEAQSRAQAAAPAPDSPAVFAVEVSSSLLPAPLPTAAALRAGAAALVDLEASEDPWPREPRAGLLGASERDAARAASSALAEALSLGGRTLVVERAAGAPYAAAWVQGKLRLNPALLYLAAGVAQPSPPKASEPAPAGSAASCSAAPGAPALGLAVLAIAGLVRRRR
jgi:uncharacterized protein (TIGR03382 family)